MQINLLYLEIINVIKNKYIKINNHKSFQIPIDFLLLLIKELLNNWRNGILKLYHYGHCTETKSHGEDKIQPSKGVCVSKICKWSLSIWGEDWRIERNQPYF